MVVKKLIHSTTIIMPTFGLIISQILGLNHKNLQIKRVFPIETFNHFTSSSVKAFLPLVALQHHQVEIKINFDDTYYNDSVLNLTAAQKRINVYGNYIYLDKEERETFTTRNLDFIITQTQRLDFPVSNVFDNTIESGGYNDLDISTLNHPVKSIFWGFGASSEDFANDRFTFLEADLQINGTHLFEKMSPVYFHTVQNYYKSSYGASDFVSETNVLFNTRYFVYHFCLNASDYNPSGTCNFSRIDNAVLSLNGVEKGNLRAAGQDISLFAVNYNVLRIKDGLAGILFGN